MKGMIQMPNTASTSPRKWKMADAKETGRRSSGCITRKLVSLSFSL